ncbi:MAG: O-antigen ligase family protein [Chromatocurvus sp.]
MTLRPSRAAMAEPGSVGLYLFALTAFSQRALAVVGCLLMLYALWRDRSRAWPLLRQTPLFWCTAALAAYTVARTGLAVAQDPQNAALHAKDAARILYLCAFIAIAWALHGDHTRILRFLVAAAAGFVAARLWHFDWQLNYPQPWWQMRLGLGLETIGLGYYAGTLLLGMLVFAPRMLAQAHRPRDIAGIGLLLTAVVAAGLQWVILSQSRAAWLALLPLTALAALFALHSSWRRGGLPALALMSAPLALLLVIGGLNAPNLMQRLAEEQHTIGLLLDGNLDAISSADERGWEHSIGTRIQMLEAGYRQWLGAPFLGFGPAASKLTLLASDDRVLQQYNDYHNVALDMLVRYGMLGLLLLLLCGKYTLSSGWQAWRRGLLPTDTALFLAGTLCLLLASSLSNFRLLNFDFRYWLFIVAAPMTTFAICACSTEDRASG